MRRVFVGLAQVFVGLAAHLRNNRLLQIFSERLNLTLTRTTLVPRVYEWY